MVQRSRAQRLNGLFPLSYTGVVPVSPVNFVMDSRAPTINDSKNFYIGDMWLDISSLPAIPPTTSNLWVLVSLTGNDATWVNFASGISALQSLTGNSGGPVSVDGADNINVVGTGVITVVGNPGTHTLTVTPSGSIASSFITNPSTGTAIPVAGALTFAGSGGIAVSASGHTVTITNSGTPAAQVAFGAYKSLDSNNVTGDGTFYQVICDGELYDLDNNYDPITGIFTAPTDGTYHFDTYIACHNIADQNLSGLNIETTNVIFHSDLQSPVINKSIDNILHFQLSVDINMNAGDTTLIKISLGGGSGAKVVGVTGAIPPGSPVATYFSGHRIDPAASFISGAETFITDAGTAAPNILGQVNVKAQNASLGCGSSVIISAPGSSNTIELDVTDTNSNTIIGKNSGNLTLTSTGTVALGAGQATALTSGSSNTFINAATSAITTGSKNIIIGFGAGANLGATDTNNTVISDAAQSGVSGYVGISTAGAGFPFMHNFPGSGGGNVFMGYLSGSSIVSAANMDNSSIGQSSLQNLTTGTSNFCGGYQSGLNLLTGVGNTLLGRDAGNAYAGAESGNICIGNGVTGVVGESNKTKIGGIRGATTTNNDAVAVLIDSAGQLGTVSSSMRYKSNREPMGSVSDRLMDLEPVTFSWKKDQNYVQQVGLIAEEVEEVFPELVVHDKEGLPETVKYHELPVLLLNELKKLADRVKELEKRLK